MARYNMLACCIALALLPLLASVGIVPAARPTLVPGTTRIVVTITPAHASPATLTGQWQPAGYAVTWIAPEPACLVIHQQLLGGVPCATTGQVVLPRAGGDWHTAAIPGRTLTLVAATAITQPLVSVVIPEEMRRVALPLVAGQ